MTYGPRNRLLVLSRAGTWVVLFMGRTKHDILARPEAQHDTINFGSCRHDTNARVVSCLVSRHDERHGTTRILGRAWADTVQKWPICKSLGQNLPYMYKKPTRWG
jgi:hypothetical protein